VKCKQNVDTSGSGKMLASCLSKAVAASTSASGSETSFLIRTSSALVNSMSVLSLAGQRQQDNQGPILNSDISVRFRARPFKKTLSRRFPGHIDMYDAKDGKRQILYSAVERYKRLDWGMYVGTKTGRYNKRWKKWDSTNWSKEQHMFMDRESNLVLERMFSHDIKLPRYIPDDPWQKYNEMPFWRHRAGLLKNRKLIEKHGNTDHMYGRYMSHMKGTYGKDNIMPKHYYMPPDYLQTVATSPSKAYLPDKSVAAPSNDPAPHFQRQKLRMRGREHRHDRLRELYSLRKKEAFLDKPLPLWNEGFHPTTNER